MSRPEDIPEEVLMAAADVAIMLPGFPSIEATSDAVERIARAIMAAKAEEREACAKLADEERLNPFNSGGMDTAFREIAKAIRKRGEA